MTEEEFGCVLVATGICGISLACGGVLCAVAALGNAIINWLESKEK